MAEDNNIILASQEPSLGVIKIAPEVVEVIIGIAASQVGGVYSMRGSLANSVSKLFGKENRSKGVKLDQKDSSLKVDVYALLNYGVSVPKVAYEIQEKVKQQVLFMTGLKLDVVDVHIQGIVPEKQEPTIAPNKPLAEEHGEE